MFYVLLVLINGPQAGETLGRINRSFLVNLDGFYEGYWSGLEFSTLPFRIQGVLISFGAYIAWTPLSNSLIFFWNSTVSGLFNTIGNFAFSWMMPFPGVSTRAFSLPVFRSVSSSKIIADTGASNTLAFSLQPGDSVEYSSPVDCAAGQSSSCLITRFAECIIDWVVGASRVVDQLFCIGRFVVLRNGEFHWTKGECKLNHALLPKPILCTIENYCPVLKPEDFRILREISAGQTPQLRTFLTESLGKIPFSVVILGRRDRKFDECERLFSKQFLLQYSSAILSWLWVKCSREYQSFVRAVQALQRDYFSDTFLRGGAPPCLSGYMEDASPQVHFVDNPSLQLMAHRDQETADADATNIEYEDSFQLRNGQQSQVVLQSSSPLAGSVFCRQLNVTGESTAHEVDLNKPNQSSPRQPESSGSTTQSMDFSHESVRMYQFVPSWDRVDLREQIDGYRELDRQAATVLSSFSSLRNATCCPQAAVTAGKEHTLACQRVQRRMSADPSAKRVQFSKETFFDLATRQSLSDDGFRRRQKMLEQQWRESQWYRRISKLSNRSLERFSERDAGSIRYDDEIIDSFDTFDKPELRPLQVPLSIHKRPKAFFPTRQKEATLKDVRGETEELREAELEDSQALFEVMQPADVKQLSDELICNDDIANSRKVGAKSFGDQEKLVSLLRGGRPMVSADLCFPKYPSLQMTCIWVVEILVYSVVDETIARLVLPFPVRSESFDDFRPVLLYLKYALGVLKEGYQLKTEMERAVKNVDFPRWCAENSITTVRTQAHRHPSFEVAVGQVERYLRKIHWSQSLPGSVLWAATCNYLRFRLMRDAEPVFDVSIAFKHEFPIGLIGRISWSPLPWKKSGVAEPVAEPVIPLYPISDTHNVIVALCPQPQSHLGLKLAELHMGEVKIGKTLAFRRDISSTLSIRHLLNQPFTSTVVLKAKAPKHIECPACVRAAESVDDRGRGRPPTRHTCSDTCRYAPVLRFSDPEVLLSTPCTSGSVKAQAFAEIASHDSIADVAPPLQHRTDSDGPVFRRAVARHLSNIDTWSDPELRRFTGMQDLDPSQAAAVHRAGQNEQMRTQLRRLAAQQVESEMRTWRKERSGKSDKKHVPTAYAVILKPKDEARKVENDLDYGKLIWESEDREIGNLLTREILGLKKVEDLTPEDEVIPSIAILALKPDGRIKCRLVACGNFQQDVDQEACYSSAVDAMFWRLLLIIAIQAGWTVCGIDVSEAFTQADRKDNVNRRTFLKLPSQWKGVLLPPSLAERGVTVANFDNWLLQVISWIYGERGAPKAWRESFVRWLKSLKSLGKYVFVQSVYDENVLFVVSATAAFIICVYVDDVWLFVQVAADCREFLTLLRARYKCTDPEYLCGDPDSSSWCNAICPKGAPSFLACSIYFVVRHSQLFLVLDQREYLRHAFEKLVVKEVISKSDLETPLQSLDCKVFAYSFLAEEVPDNPLLTSAQVKLVRIGVNTISYVGLKSRPELLPALGQIARGQTEKGRARFLSSMLMLLRYVFTTRNRVLHLPTGVKNVTDVSKARPKRIADLNGVSIFRQAEFDASLGSIAQNGITDAHARQGCHLFVSLYPDEFRAPFLSKCGIQPVVSISITDSELISCTSCAREQTGSDNFVKEIFTFCLFPPAILYGDNNAANVIAAGTAAIRKVRHLALPLLWVRGIMAQGNLKIISRRTTENTADLVTKVLGAQALAPLLLLLGLYEIFHG